MLDFVLPRTKTFFGEDEIDRAGRTSRVAKKDMHTSEIGQGCHERVVACLDKAINLIQYGRSASAFSRTEALHSHETVKTNRRIADHKILIQDVK
jgi:hypothetical protein